MLQKLSLCRCFSSNVSQSNPQFCKRYSRTPSPENPDTNQQTLGKTKCCFFLQAHIHDGNFQFSFYTTSLTSKPNSLHLQIETYIQLTFWRDFACRVQTLPCSEVSSINFFLPSPWVESVLCYDFYPEIWGTSCSQKAITHLSSYSMAKRSHQHVFHQSHGKKEKISLIFLSFHRRTLTDGNIGLLFKNKESLSRVKL